MMRGVGDQRVSVDSGSHPDEVEAFVVGTFLVVAVLVLVGWAIHAVVRPRPVFVVRVRGGVPRTVTGRVTRGFCQDVADTFARHGVRNGEVRGHAADRRIDLWFSPSVPAPCRQQIRNIWNVSGWAGAGRKT